MVAQRYIYNICQRILEFAVQPVKSVKPASPAQWCNADVLHEIMTFLPNADVASSCLVARGWVDVCRSRLYTNIYFSPIFRAPGSSTATLPKHFAPRLSRTLNENPTLRGYIRNLTIRPLPLSPNDGHLYDWLTFIVRNLRTLELIQSRRDEQFSNIFMSLSPFPNVHHVSFISNTMKENRITIQQTLALFPNACSFSLDLSFVEDNLDPPPQIRNIRRFSIGVPNGSMSRIASFVSLYTHSLTRLDICADEVEDAGVLVPIISKMHHLERLAIVTQCHVNTPFLDLIIPHLPQLRELYCTMGGYTSTMLHHLPSQIETLWLGCAWIDHIDVPAIQEMVWRSLKGEIRLSRLCVLFARRKEEVEMISAVCLAAGVVFESYTTRSRNYDPMGI